MPTKIKRDEYGLYVHAGGWKARPFYGTCFKEGDEVKTHHFGGTTMAGVGLPNKATFRRSSNNLSFEYWCTCGTLTYRDDAYEHTHIKWYWEHVRIGASYFADSHNKKYAASIRRKYQSALEQYHGSIIDLYKIGTCIF